VCSIVFQIIGRFLVEDRGGDIEADGANVQQEPIYAGGRVGIMLAAVGHELLKGFSQ
jgi:hypothetical protein